MANGALPKKSITLKRCLAVSGIFFVDTMTRMENDGACGGISEHLKMPFEAVGALESPEK
jgi:hypothetical protein